MFQCVNALADKVDKQEAPFTYSDMQLHNTHAYGHIIQQHSLL